MPDAGGATPPTTPPAAPAPRHPARRGLPHSPRRRADSRGAVLPRAVRARIGPIALYGLLFTILRPGRPRGLESCTWGRERA
jgi:hypothetical protein